MKLPDDGRFPRKKGDDIMGKIYVQAAPEMEDGKTAFWEVNPRHPEGEVFIVAGSEKAPFIVEETPDVITAMSERRLVSVNKRGLSERGAPDDENEDPNERTTNKPSDEELQAAAADLERIKTEQQDREAELARREAELEQRENQARAREEAAKQAKADEEEAAKGEADDPSKPGERQSRTQEAANKQDENGGQRRGR
jgi:flagellar biosynthesis GTPase FlhF